MAEDVRDATLSITEVSEVTGLQASALRYYESVGLIEPTTRVGGRRHYDPSVLRRLAVIALLQEVGFTIGEIGDLLSHRERGARWRRMAERKLEEIDSHLARVSAARELLVSALECGCSEIESCGLVGARRGRHRTAVQTLMLGMGPPAS